MTSDELRCKRCGIGVDDDWDGNCAVCAGIPNHTASRVRYEIDHLRQQLADSKRRYQDTERDYILPVFNWAKDIDFDLPNAVRVNPGKNCVELFFAHMKQQLAEAQRLSPVLLPSEEQQMLEELEAGRIAAAEHLQQTILAAEAAALTDVATLCEQAGIAMLTKSNPMQGPSEGAYACQRLILDRITDPQKSALAERLREMFLVK